jgi:hypothetical protein
MVSLVSTTKHLKLTSGAFVTIIFTRAKAITVAGTGIPFAFGQAAIDVAVPVATVGCPQMSWSVTNWPRQSEQKPFNRIRVNGCVVSVSERGRAP